MKPAAAMMRFFNSHPGHSLDITYPKINVTELREFKQSCSPEEFEELARQACDLMGEVFEPITPEVTL